MATQTACKPGVRLRSCHPRTPGEKIPQRDPSSPGWRPPPSTLQLPSPSVWIWHHLWETPCPGRLCPAQDVGTVGTGRGRGTAFPGRGPADRFAALGADQLHLKGHIPQQGLQTPRPCRQDCWVQPSAAHPRETAMLGAHVACMACIWAAGGGPGASLCLLGPEHPSLSTNLQDWVRNRLPQRSVPRKRAPLLGPNQRLPFSSRWPWGSPPKLTC